MKSRKVYFDSLKIIAIFFVLYAHTGDLAIHHYRIESGRFSYLFALAFQQLSYICNSLFFFISGALLLNKQENLTILFRKRVLKYFILIIVFGLIQYLYSYYRNPEIGISFSLVSKTLYSSNVTTTYWFLHSYLAFLLMLPFLRIIAGKMTKELSVYLLSLLIIIDGLLPVVELFWKNDRIALSIPLFEMSLIFPMLGYYFEHVFNSEKITLKYLLPWNIAALASWIVYTFYNKKCFELTGSDYNYVAGLSVILLIALYFDIKYVCLSLSGFFDSQFGKIIVKILSVFGKSTLVIYLFNNILCDLFHFLYDALYLKISWIGATFVWLSVVIIVGACLSFIYESIKKWLLVTVSHFSKQQP